MEIRCIIERIGGISGKRLFIRRIRNISPTSIEVYSSESLRGQIGLGRRQVGSVSIAIVDFFPKVDVLNISDDSLLDKALEIMQRFDPIDLKDGGMIKREGYWMFRVPGKWIPRSDNEYVLLDFHDGRVHGLESVKFGDDDTYFAESEALSKSIWKDNHLNNG